MDQTNLVMYTFEFKRTSDREHGYVQQCDAMKERQSNMQVFCKLSEAALEEEEEFITIESG